MDGQQYDIRVQLADADRNNPQAIANVIVGYQNGAARSIWATWRRSPPASGRSRLTAYDRQREIAVTAYLRPGFQPGNASAPAQQASSRR